MGEESPNCMGLAESRVEESLGAKNLVAGGKPVGSPKGVWMDMYFCWNQRLVPDAKDHLSNWD